MFSEVAVAEIPEVGGGLSADGDSFVLLIVAFKDLLDLWSLQQGHTGGQLSVAVVWMTRTSQINTETATDTVNVELSWLAS